MEKIMSMNQTASNVTGGNRVSGLKEKSESDTKDILTAGR